MLVHRSRAPQESEETFTPYLQRYGKTDGGPQGIASTHPIPKTEGALFANTELRHRRSVRGQRYEMISDCFSGKALGEEPIHGTVRVGHGFLGREGF